MWFIAVILKIITKSHWLLYVSCDQNFLISYMEAIWSHQIAFIFGEPPSDSECAKQVLMSVLHINLIHVQGSLN
jgi:hypothetical protein